MAKILVTGGAGFIGSNLVDALIDRGGEVVIIDNLSTGKEDYINPKAKFYKIDVCSDDVKNIFETEKPEYVFHLAAQMDVRKSVEDPVFDNKVNILGGLNIYNNAVRNNIKKIIFISTGGALYGDVKKPANEGVLPNPDSPYAVHKLASEQHLKILSNIHGIDYLILRLANVYGPRQYKGGEGAVVAVFTANAIEEKESTIFGDGKQTRDFVYVDDVVKACILSLEKGKGVYNIGSAKAVNLFDIIESISTITKKDFKFKHAPERPEEIRDSVLSAQRAEKELGWGIEINLEDGISKTIDWFKKYNNLN